VLTNLGEHLNPRGTRHELRRQLDNRHIAEGRHFGVDGERLPLPRRCTQRSPEPHQGGRTYGSIGRLRQLTEDLRRAAVIVLLELRDFTVSEELSGRLGPVGQERIKQQPRRGARLDGRCGERDDHAAVHGIGHRGLGAACPVGEALLGGREEALERLDGKVSLMLEPFLFALRFDILVLSQHFPTEPAQ